MAEQGITRRNFLKKSAKGAAALTLASVPEPLSSGLLVQTINSSSE